MRDFEFDIMSLVESERDESNASPADELFFKGQLLPLHLPPRLRMVESLSMKDEEGGYMERLAKEDEKSDSFSFKPCELNHKHFVHGCFCSSDTFSPKDLWPDLRSSSFDSQLSSFWDSGDRDSLDSSCRDSNGSSQDSCISGRDMQMVYKSNHASENANVSRSDYFNSRNQNCKFSWLRIPFSWKPLLGSKKASQIKLNSKSGQKSSYGGERKAVVGKRSYHSNSFRLSSPFLISSFHVSEKSVRQPRKNSNRNFHTMINRTDSKLLDLKHSDLNASGVWNDYIKALKPATSSAYSESRFFDKRDPCQLHGRQGRMYIFDRSTAKNADIDESSERRPSCSFLSGTFNLRISSFSRRSSTSTSRVNSSHSSPNHSGVLVCTSSYEDTTTGLHCAIQGAIAHCKESQPQPQPLSQSLVTISENLSHPISHSSG